MLYFIIISNLVCEDKRVRFMNTYIFIIYYIATGTNLFANVFFFPVECTERRMSFGLCLEKKRFHTYDDEILPSIYRDMYVWNNL